MTVAQSQGFFDDFRQVTFQCFQGDMAAGDFQVVVGQKTGKLPDLEAAMSRELNGRVTDLRDFPDRTGKVFLHLFSQRIHLQGNRYLGHI
jgi:hypothetical protein